MRVQLRVILPIFPKLLFVLCLPIAAASAKGGGRGTSLTLLEQFPKQTFPAQMADFGDQFLDKARYRASLIMPPGNQYLCEYPEELKEVSKEEIDDYFLYFQGNSNALALLVSRGNCLFDDKARVALEIQRNITSRLKYMVVYNNDEKERTKLVTMTTNNTRERLNQLLSLGFVFISTDAGQETLSVMGQHSKKLNANPYLLQESSNNWFLPVEINIFPIPPSTSPPSSQSGESRGEKAARESFQWLRFVLFSLLIVSPCARAGYLWWSGGGRILLRRNSRGRIIGFMYVRPMPYWYASGPDTNRDEEVSDCLTEEQVMGLPEIVYRTKKDNRDTDTDDDHIGDDDDDDDDDDVDVSNTNNTVDENKKDSDNQEGLSPPSSFAKEEKELDEEQPSQQVSNESSTKALESSTPRLEGNDTAVVGADYLSSSMCSICIDDFEDGEKIRMLPRCQHLFHLDCIKPWLIERQGCCPLCKTRVLESEAAEEDEDKDGTNTETAQSISAAGESSEQDRDQASTSTSPPTPNQQRAT